MSTHQALVPSVLLGILGCLGALAAADSDAGAVGMEFFETHIRPILSEKCYQCHSVSSTKIKGHLLVDSRQGLLTGGDSGPAIKAGDPEHSKLIEAIRYHNDDMQMPPKGQLPKEVIEDFVTWVKLGAPDPRTSSPGTPVDTRARINQAAKEHWAFQAPKAEALPTPPAHARIQTPIDSWVCAKLEEAHLRPAPPADKRTLIRRATFDLLGLPPSDQEVQAFLGDSSPDAFAVVVDRLLASPQYGERWARYWLDVARYADTKGYVFEEDRHYPFSYTYRDWVINAFNHDMPYDRFLMAQIAADQMQTDTSDLAALGFITVGRRFLNQVPDIIDDRIDVVCRGMMALTVGCARCHDHKFDPIPTKDYYSLYGVFDSSIEPKELPLLGNAADPAQTAAFDQELGKARQEVDSFLGKRYDELLAHMHQGEVIAAYLMALHDAVGADGRINDDAIAQKRNLRLGMLRRWRTFLDARPTNDALFAPWKSYSVIDEHDFTDKASTVTSTLRSLPLNPLVAEALCAQVPASLQEVANRYGVLLGDNAAAHSDHAALSAVLSAEHGPLAVPASEVETVLFDGEDIKKVRDLRNQVQAIIATHPGSPPRAMALADAPNPHNVHVFIRGSRTNQGDEAPRQFLALLAGPQRVPFTHGSGRLELAQAIANRNNPLTARVYVNRIWAHHFGMGLVRTVSDFGLRSDAPVNRGLLDWLAVHFMDEGWSTKKLQRLIMLSAVYQQSDDNPAVDAKVDPGNALLWHFNRQRLDFEAMRDSVLKVCGRLDPRMFGRAVDLTTQPFTVRRTIYGLIDRQNLASIYRTFDFASPDTHSPQRFLTTVPQQALFWMNSPFIVEQARILAESSAVGGTSPTARIQDLYRRIYQRSATAQELQWGERFLSASAQPEQPPAESLPPIWQYGWGSYDPIAKATRFNAMPLYIDKSWRSSDNVHDRVFAYLCLTQSGGHPGPDHGHAAIRRWNAPVSGVVRITGSLARSAQKGDGVRGMIISSRAGVVGDWVVTTGSVQTTAENLTVDRGTTLDFLVDCRDNDGWDSFEWSPVLHMDNQESWNASQQFAGPAPPPPVPLTPWEAYAQVLLMANEFMFID